MKRSKSPPQQLLDELAEVVRATAITERSAPMPKGGLDEAARAIGVAQLAWLPILEALNALEADPTVTASAPAAHFVRICKALAVGAFLPESAADVLRPLDAVLPNGKVGQRFTRGRKVGTVSRVRRFIHRYLAKTLPPLRRSSGKRSRRIRSHG